MTFYAIIKKVNFKRKRKGQKFYKVQKKKYVKGEKIFQRVKAKEKRTVATKRNKSKNESFK